jgi:molybdopterin-guanine dinucleotide biosynthesis protein A
LEASGIILAGGLSSRMGRDKTMMTYNNETLIGHMVGEMRKVAKQIIISSNHTAKYNIPDTLEVPDIYPGMGPMAGMHAGLLAAENSHAFIIAADMPLFKAELAQYLLERSPGYDIVVPTLKGRWEPLCAVYSRNCIKPIEDCLKADIRQIFRFFPQVKVLKVAEDELSEIGKIEDLFYNVNTPEDYQAFCDQKRGEADNNLSPGDHLKK